MVQIHPLIPVFQVSPNPFSPALNSESRVLGIVALCAHNYLTNMEHFEYHIQ